MTKRINHKKLHDQLELMGYEVFKCDYSYGSHTYQIQKEEEWHEYNVITKDGNKTIDLSGVGVELANLIKKYYEEQEVKVTGLKANKVKVELDQETLNKLKDKFWESESVDFCEGFIEALLTIGVKEEQITYINHK